MNGPKSSRIVRLSLLIPLFVVLAAILFVGIELQKERALLAEAQAALTEAEERYDELQSHSDATETTDSEQNK